MISFKSLLPLVLASSSVADANMAHASGLFFSNGKDLDAGFLQDVLLYTMHDRDLRECSQSGNHIVCRTDFDLSNGQKCSVTATCPADYNRNLSLCTCSIEIDGDLCQECSYCSNRAAAIDCTDVYQENGCSGVTCDGGCIAANGVQSGGGSGTGGGQPLFFGYGETSGAFKKHGAFVALAVFGLVVNAIVG